MSVYRYCPQCGHTVQPFLDGERLRSRCPACGRIHYQNPTVGVAVVLIETGSLLLGKRKSGGWCIPCGHVEWDENVRQAAVREFAEETGLQVMLSGICAIHSNFHDPAHHTVGIWWYGQRVRGEIIPGGDLSEVSFFPLGKLPDLVYPTDCLVTADLRAGSPINKSGLA